MVGRNKRRVFDQRLLAIPQETPRSPSFQTADREQLLTAVSCMDLTSLTGSETKDEILLLCETARRPLPAHPEIRVGAVCVFDRHVETAVEALRDTGISVAAVTGGFPIPDQPLATRVEDVRCTVSMGADEIDVVINRSLAFEEKWSLLYDEVAALREASKNAILKVILATGDLEEPERIWRASVTAMMAGADFIKTSTGREQVNATIPHGLVMAQAISYYEAETGNQVGLKPAGAIRIASQALAWTTLVENQLGESWLRPRLFRIGASSLLEDIKLRLGELQLEPS